LSNKVPYRESMNIEKSLLYKKRKIATDKEMVMLNIRSAFDIIKQEAGRVVVFTRLVFVIKLSPAENRFKACFMVCRGNQEL
jgi:hypothetical protein